MADLKLLNVGCGNDLREGYLNVDILPPPLLTGNMMYKRADGVNLFEAVGGGWDGILSIYMVEHVPVRHLYTMFYNWNKCLKMNGTVRIVVPSLVAMIDLYQDSSPLDLSVFRRLIYEGMGGPEETGVSPHTALWTVEWLEHFMTAEGFNLTQYKDKVGSHCLGLVAEFVKVTDSNTTEDENIWVW